MKLVLIVVAVLVLLVVVMALVGAMVPVAHSETISVKVAAPVEKVFELVDDVARAPSWRSKLEKVEGDREAFVEVSGGDRLPMRVIERQVPSKRVTRIDDPSLPFGGTWTWTFTADERGTTVTIREDGEVRNVIFRFLSRFVFGHRGTLERVAADLSRALATS